MPDVNRVQGRPHRDCMAAGPCKQAAVAKLQYSQLNEYVRNRRRASGSTPCSQARKRYGRENGRRILDAMFGTRNLREHEENVEKRPARGSETSQVKVNARIVEHHK